MSIFTAARARSRLETTLIASVDRAPVDSETHPVFDRMRLLLGPGYQKSVSTPQNAHLEAGYLLEAPLLPKRARHVLLERLRLPVAVLGGACNTTLRPPPLPGHNAGPPQELSPRARGALMVGCARPEELNALGIRTRSPGVVLALDGLRASERSDRELVLDRASLLNVPPGWASIRRVSPETECSEPMLPAPMLIAIAGGAWPCAIASAVLAGEPLPNDPATGRTVLSLLVDHLVRTVAGIERAFADNFADKKTESLWDRARSWPARRRTLRVRKVLLHNAHGPSGESPVRTKEYLEKEADSLALLRAVDLSLREQMVFASVLVAEGAPVARVDAEALNDLFQRIPAALAAWFNAWSICPPLPPPPSNAPILLRTMVDRVLLDSVGEDAPSRPDTALSSWPASRRRL